MQRASHILEYPDFFISMYRRLTTKLTKTFLIYIHTYYHNNTFIDWKLLLRKKQTKIEIGI